MAYEDRPDWAKRDMGQEPTKLCSDFSSHHQVYLSLHKEFFRLRQLEIVPDVADVMAIIRPFLKV